MSNWIFCKDKLPDKHDRYLVVYPMLDSKLLYIDILYYGKSIFRETLEPYFYTFDFEFGDVEYDDVVAWMPLPELWEGAEDEILREQCRAFMDIVEQTNCAWKKGEE